MSNTLTYPASRHIALSTLVCLLWAYKQWLSLLFAAIQPADWVTTGQTGHLWDPRLHGYPEYKKVNHLGYIYYNKMFVNLSLSLFCQVVGKKDLVLETSLMRPLDRIAGASLLKVSVCSH